MAITSLWSEINYLVLVNLRHYLNNNFDSLYWHHKLRSIAEGLRNICRQVLVHQLFPVYITGFGFK